MHACMRASKHTACLRWAVCVRLGVFVLPAGLRITARGCARVLHVGRSVCVCACVCACVCVRVCAGACADAAAVDCPRCSYLRFQALTWYPSSGGSLRLGARLDRSAATGTGAHLCAAGTGALAAAEGAGTFSPTAAPTYARPVAPSASAQSDSAAHRPYAIPFHRAGTAAARRGHPARLRTARNASSGTQQAFA